MRVTGFTADNISGMLDKSEWNVGGALDALLKNQHTLEAIIEKKAFTPTNLSSMLHGAGKNIGAAIEDISNHERYAKLCELADTFGADKVANRLNNESKRRLDSPQTMLGANIDEVYTIVTDELKGITNLVTGSRPQIADMSHAALVAREMAVAK